MTSARGCGSIISKRGQTSFLRRSAPQMIMVLCKRQQPSLGRVAVALFHDNHEGDCMISPVERQSQTHQRHLLSEDVTDRQPLLRERVYHNSTAFASGFFVRRRGPVRDVRCVLRADPAPCGAGFARCTPFLSSPSVPEGAIFTRRDARSKITLDKASVKW